MKRRIPPGAGMLILVIAACVMLLWFVALIGGKGRDAEIERIVSAGRVDGPGASLDTPPPGVQPAQQPPNVPPGP